MAPTPKGRAERTKEERRGQILSAALSLFADKGMHDTAVSQIASRAGVSQGTVYWYFESKEELFRTAFLELFQETLQPLFRILGDESLEAADRLRSVAQASLDVFVEKPELAQLLLQVMATRGLAEIVAHDFSAYYMQFASIIAPLFADRQDPDPQASAALYMGLLDGMMLQLVLAPDLVDRDRALRQLAKKFNLEE